MDWTWDYCREKYKFWGTLYDKLLEAIPNYKLSEEEQKTSLNFKILMRNMIDLINVLESSPEYHNVNKRVGHTTLSLGFGTNTLVSGCSIDWLINVHKYQISFTNELSFIVNLEQVIPTIRLYILRFKEIDHEQGKNPE